MSFIGPQVKADLDARYGRTLRGWGLSSDIRCQCVPSVLTRIIDWALFQRCSINSARKTELIKTQDNLSMCVCG